MMSILAKRKQHVPEKKSLTVRGAITIVQGTMIYLRRRSGRLVAKKALNKVTCIIHCRKKKGPAVGFLRRMNKEY